MTSALLFAACGLASAPANWLLCRPDWDQVAAFGIQDWASADGVTAPMLSTLIMGEMRTGVLSSPAFAAPRELTLWVAGHSHKKKNEVRLVRAASGEVLRREPAPGTNEAQRITWDLTGVAGSEVALEIVDGDDGSGWAWIAVGRVTPDVAPMPTTGGGLPKGWSERPFEETGLRTACGIPYLHRPGSPTGGEGGVLRMSVPRVRARYAYVFTGEHRPDSANPAWGGGDSAQNFFIGDRAGDLVLSYASGREDVIPLVFGYTMWWREPYGFAPAPFSTDKDARALLDEALCVANGAEAWKGDGLPFFVRIALRKEPVVAITLRDDPAKAGHTLLQGVTFGNATAWEDAEGVEPVSGGDMEAALSTWLEGHTLRGTTPYPNARRRAVAALADLLYTYPDEVAHRRIASAVPKFDGSAWDGPSIRFYGPPEAELLTRTFYDSAQELLRRIEPNGMVHESAPDAPNFGGFGTWRPDLAPFHGAAYTRNRSMAVLSLLGFQQQCEDVLRFFDRWIMYFPESYPALQIDGKPVPGHSTVIANKPHVYFDELRHAGWPTRYTSRDFGNPENDGHGFLMLGHWRAWLKAGRMPEWVRERWQPLREAADYIPWCLENPELSFSQHGLLYSESEAGMNAVTLYCNVPCYYGLLACAEMAEAVGKTDAAARWRATAEGMYEAMETYFTAQDESGDVWDPAKAGSWGYSQGVFAPLFFGADYFGWDAASLLPGDWRGRTLRSYEAALERMQPKYCAPQGFGYGQCYYAQMALLFDHMAEADPMLRWLARFCYSPGLPNPHRVPEGATIAGDYSVWRRWGDLGNLYQMNEATYTVQVMVGVDDMDSHVLRLMPRVPSSWHGLDVVRYPAQALSNGTPKTIHMEFTLRHRPQKQRLAMELAGDRPVDHLRLRLGPLPQGAGNIAVYRDRKEIPFERVDSGDSQWVWVALEAFNSSKTLFTVEWDG